MSTADDLLVTKVDRVYGKIVWILAGIAMLSVALMSVSTTMDVLKRWITGWPFGGVMQLSECLMVVLVFLGIPFAQRFHRHIRIGFIVARMTDRNAVICDLIACCLAVVCLVLLGIMTTKEAIYSFSIREYRVGDVRLPIYWARALIPVGCFIFTGQLIIGVWRNVEKLRGNLTMQVSDIRSINKEGN
jgi:TRAP-type C4-dicarboxylate transport system permease small subunit